MKDLVSMYNFMTIIIANSILSISSYIVVTLSYGYEMKVHR